MAVVLIVIQMRAKVSNDIADAVGLDLSKNIIVLQSRKTMITNLTLIDTDKEFQVML